MAGRRRRADGNWTSKVDVYNVRRIEDPLHTYTILWARERVSAGKQSVLTKLFHGVLPQSRSGWGRPAPGIDCHPPRGNQVDPPKYRSSHLFYNLPSSRAPPARARAVDHVRVSRSGRTEVSPGGSSASLMKPLRLTPNTRWRVERARRAPLWGGTDAWARGTRHGAVTSRGWAHPRGAHVLRGWESRCAAERWQEELYVHLFFSLQFF